MMPTLIHIPHSSAWIPEPYLPLFRLRGRALRAELMRMTDWYTDDLFADCGTRVILPVSRLICDVERFRDPSMECMTARGMWVCYERASDLRPLKTVTPAHRDDVLASWYDPHHARLAALTGRALQECGRVLIVDAHSFSSVRLSYETGGGVRPDICVGADDDHTPAALRRACAEGFAALGYNVAINQPFSGCLVPMPFYRRDTRVLGVMIEINRRLYMDENMGEKLSAYTAVRRDINRVIAMLSRAEYGA